MWFRRWRHALPARWRAIVGRAQADRELDEELRFHVDEKARYYADRGLSASEARRLARREFGGVERATVQCRETRRLPVIETIWQDVRYSVRVIRRNPAFAAIAVLTLGLGVGANTAIFSLVNGILLRPLPYGSPDHLVSVTATYPKGAFVEMRRQVGTMQVAAYAQGLEITLSGQDAPVRLTAALVSAELFSVLGVQPQIGRGFEPGEDLAGSTERVILSDRLWRERFRQDRAILGRPIVLGGIPHQIVGVMAPSFDFPTPHTDVWMPFRADARRPEAYWAGDFMPIVGRLKPGVTIAQAQSDVRAFQSRVGPLFPWKMPASWNADIAVVPLQRDMVGSVRVRLYLLLGAVTLVLLIACANVANLTLSRAASRDRELGVRAALGAGQRRIARQLFTESLVLSTLGGALGLALAVGAVDLLKYLLPANTPRLMDVHIDWRVLIFTGLTAAATGVVFGLAPALQSSRSAIAGTVRSSGRGAVFSIAPRLRSILVVAETALAVLLVIAAGLLIRSLWGLSHVKTGFRSDEVITARVAPDTAFCAEPAACTTFYRRLVARVQQIPGVADAGLVNTPPLGGKVAKRSLTIEGFTPPSGQPAPLFWLNTVTPGYFSAMGITLLSGTTFSEADMSGQSLVAIVDAPSAQKFWPGENPIGRKVRFVGEQDWRTIVGVVGDVRAFSLQNALPAWIVGTLYVPYSPRATLEDARVPAEMTLVVHQASGGTVTGETLRRIVAEESRDVAVTDITTMGQTVAAAASAPASTTALFVCFAALALVLGTIGVYGVLSFNVSRRTREIGIRIALGAQGRDVVWSVVKEGLTSALAGIAIGIGVAIVATRWLTGELYGVSPLDPATYAVVALAIVVVTILACMVPALRATRVDPLIALRTD